jgi:hypothetical protein
MEGSVMKGRTLFSPIVLIAALLLHVSGEGFAGVVVEQVVRDRDGTPSKALLYISDHQYRADRQETGMTTIMDFKEDRLVMIAHRSKSYVEVKLSLWEKEMAKRLKKESPGLRPTERKITVKRTGRTAVINGFQTEEIQVLAEGELIEENWVTRDVEMKEIQQVMDRVVKEFSRDYRPEMKEGLEIHEKLRPYGYPVLVKDHAITYGLGALDRVEVKKMEKRELKEDVFLPPPDYQKIIPEPSKK